jgi:D-glycero-D-manno-heptose 1,7-bisphosphate phosphatase
MILKTVFLDRDGVINKKMPEGEYVRSIEDFHLLPGVPAAIARLNRAGARVIVVSNQRGVARVLEGERRDGLLRNAARQYGKLQL